MRGWAGTAGSGGSRQRRQFRWSRSLDVPGNGPPLYPHCARMTVGAQRARLVCGDRRQGGPVVCHGDGACRDAVLVQCVDEQVEGRWAVFPRARGRGIRSRSRALCPPDGADVDDISRCVARWTMSPATRSPSEAGRHLGLDVLARCSLTLNTADPTIGAHDHMPATLTA